MERPLKLIAASAGALLTLDWFVRREESLVVTILRNRR